MKRFLLIIPLAIIVFLVSRTGSGTTTTDAVNQPTPAPTGPTATPAPDAGLTMKAVIEQLATPRPMHVAFKGSDASGSVEFDVVTDGTGKLSGTYTRQGLTAPVVVVNGVLYFHGKATAESYVGSQFPTSLSGWYRVAPVSGAGILGTLSNATEFRDCIEIQKDLAENLRIDPPLKIAGITTPVVLIGRADEGWPWEYAVSDKDRSTLVAWSFLSAGGFQQPASCNDGKDTHLGGPSWSITGLFLFSTPAAALPPIVAPASYTDVPGTGDPGASASPGPAPSPTPNT